MVVSFGGGGFTGILLAEEPVEGIQTLGPEAFVEAQPLMGTGERSGFEAAQMGAAAHLATDQPGILQRLDVLGGGGERDREGFRELAYRPLALGKIVEHPPTGCVAESMKDGIQLRCL